MSDQSDSGGPARLGGPPEVKFLTVAEVATLMRVSKMSVYRVIHSGALEAVQFGRSFRVEQGAVDRYLGSSYYKTG